MCWLSDDLFRTQSTGSTPVRLRTHNLVTKVVTNRTPRARSREWTADGARGSSFTGDASGEVNGFWNTKCDQPSQQLLKDVAYIPG